jgi:hypothetical protein
MSRPLSAALCAVSLFALILFPSAAFGGWVSGEIESVVPNEDLTRADIRVNYTVGQCSSLFIPPVNVYNDCYYKLYLAVVHHDPGNPNDFCPHDYLQQSPDPSFKIVWNPYEGEGLHYPSGITDDWTYDRSINVPILQGDRSQDVCFNVYETTYSPNGSKGVGTDYLDVRKVPAPPPNTVITRHKKWDKSDEVKIWFKGENGAPLYHFKCKRDKKPYKDCDSPKSYKHLGSGRHNVKVRAIDSEGDSDASPAKWSFTIRH